MISVCKTGLIHARNWREENQGLKGKFTFPGCFAAGGAETAAMDNYSGGVQCGKTERKEDVVLRVNVVVITSRDVDEGVREGEMVEESEDV